MLIRQRVVLYISDAEARYAQSDARPGTEDEEYEIDGAIYRADQLVAGIQTNIRSGVPHVLVTTWYGTLVEYYDVPFKIKKYPVPLDIEPS
jgi:hypothetical protein